MHSEIKNKIKKILKEILELDDKTVISDSSNLREDLGLDSMSSLTFLIGLEEEIEGFIADPDKLETCHLETVNSITNFVTEQIKK